MRGAGLIVLLTTGTLAAQDWPQWRGPGRDGTWAARRVPDRFAAESLKPRWQAEVGGGYSGIAVADGRVFTLDRQKGPPEVERVLCFDAAQGKLLWKHEYPVAYGKLDYGNGPRSTPTVHDGKVYTFGALGHLYCLDAKTGKLLWGHDTAKEYKGRLPTWGHACSPLVDGKKLIVQVGAPDGCLMAFDLATGAVIWRGLDDPPGYASPVLIASKQGWRQLAYWTPENVVGLDPDTGKVRWKVPYKVTYGVSISDLVWHDETLLASDYWDGCKGIVLDQRGDNPKVVYSGKRLSLLMSTPLLRDGHAYALDRNTGLKCIEVKTGKVKWEGEEVTPRGRNPHAVLIWVGERALIFNDKGELILARLSPEKYEEVSRTTVFDGKTWAHPAFAEGCLFIRDDRKLVCVPLE